MKRILLPLLSLVFVCAYAQETFKSERVTDHSTHVKGHDIDAVIFNNNYSQNTNDTLENKIKRFTPSIDDILLTEGILKADLRGNLKNANYKYILSHLKEYRRQYMGYYSKDGSRMIYINSFPIDLDWADKKIKIESLKNSVPTWYNTLFTVFDGGNSFWHAHINLRIKKIKSLAVNGVA